MIDCDYCGTSRSIVLRNGGCVMCGAGGIPPVSLGLSTVQWAVDELVENMKRNKPEPMFLTKVVVDPTMPANTDRMVSHRTDGSVLDEVRLENLNAEAGVSSCLSKAQERQKPLRRVYDRNHPPDSESIVNLSLWFDGDDASPPDHVLAAWGCNRDEIVVIYGPTRKNPYSRSMFTGNEAMAWVAR